MRVAPQQLVLAWLLDLGSGSLETPKGGHPDDEPWQLGAAAVSSPSRRASKGILYGRLAFVLVLGLGVGQVVLVWIEEAERRYPEA
eukprot:scaffold47723_cov80-Phaeocystis_antarctica.AAC.4